MRSLKDIKKAIAQAPMHVEHQADETVFERLLGGLPKSAGDSVGWQTQTGVRIPGRIAFSASAVAVVAVAAIWLIHARYATQNRETVQVAASTPSRIALLTEISLERAYRRGGVQAVEDQCREALAISTGKPVAPSCEELLTELGGNSEKMGGANL
jgi:hypothetical protein